MTFTVAALNRLTQCGHRYKLQNIEGIPVYPTTREIVSRVMRAFVRDDLSQKLSTGHLLEPQDARERIESIAKVETGQQLALTESEASTGQRRIYETILTAAMRSCMMWHAMIAPKISPSHIGRPFAIRFGDDSVVGEIEVQEGWQRVRSTKVRSRRPEGGEAESDLGLVAASLAVEQMDGRVPDEAVADYMIDTGTLSLVRQTAQIGNLAFAALEARVGAASEAVRLGSFMPAHPQDWRCRACPLRRFCPYV